MPASLEVAGLPLRRRIVLAARHAGFARVLVSGGADALAPGGTVKDESSADASGGLWRLVILSGDVVPQAGWLRGLLAAPLEPDTLYTDDAAVTVIDSEEPARLLALIDDAPDADAMLAVLQRKFPTMQRAFEPSGRFRLASGRDVPGAETWLLRSLIKQNEGFMSRLLERRLSLAITRRLAGTSITPNVMTLVSVVIGLAAAPFFLSTSPRYQLPGALVFLLHSIVDGCDGELARLKFRESRMGAVLDFWGDNVVHVAIFGCIAVGWGLAAQSVWPLLVGAVSAASTLAAAAAVSRFAMRDVPPSTPGSLAGWLLGALAHRDFIYVVVVLSAIGKASWFLVLSAAGTPLFLLLLLVSGVRSSR